FVCDTMFNFLDRDGNSVDHSINRLVMSVDLDTLKEAKHIVLSSSNARAALSSVISVLQPMRLIVARIATARWAPPE
ncbi:hypothetical protein AB9F39_39315, partial [Rhizobium leguminosarum]